MEKLCERDVLYNAVLKTLKEHGAEMEIGMVTAILAEIGGEISRRTSYQKFGVICDDLKER